MDKREIESRLYPIEKIIENKELREELGEVAVSALKKLYLKYDRLWRLTVEGVE